MCTCKVVITPLLVINRKAQNIKQETRIHKYQLSRPSCQIPLLWRVLLGTSASSDFSFSPHELSNRVYFETFLNRTVDQVNHALSGSAVPDGLASGKVGILESSSRRPQGALEVRACCLWDARPLASALTPSGHVQIFPRTASFSHQTPKPVS